jgi:hypothetical protein
MTFLDSDSDLLSHLLLQISPKSYPTQMRVLKLKPKLWHGKQVYRHPLLPYSRKGEI